MEAHCKVCAVLQSKPQQEPLDRKGCDMDDCFKPKRLILQIEKKTRMYVTFFVAVQSLRNEDFMDSLPEELINSDDMDPEEYANMDYVWLVSETLPEWVCDGGRDTLYVQGDNFSQDNKVLKASVADFKKITKSILIYNRAYSKNTLTEKDVIWTPTTSR